MGKYRKVEIEENVEVEVSVTPVGNDNFLVFDEQANVSRGTFSKENLIKSKLFTEQQLNLKGTTNYTKTKKEEVIEAVLKIEAKNQKHLDQLLINMNKQGYLYEEVKR